ncbi:hypothetical protein FRC11_002658 [Ceratobasidium sp. 423]|nr:hypothetical protein FRC11_002658 [Ceratobasidium sp. 423]
MLTRDSSDTPPSASSSTNISQNISTDDASKAIDNTMRLPSHQNSVKLSTAPEAEVGAPSESGGIHSDYNEDSAPLGLQTTPAADSGPICDPTFNFHDTNIQIRVGSVDFVAV